MGKIIVKDDAADKTADKDLEVTPKKKSKSTVKPGSELVLASSRAVAVATVPKTGAKKPGAGAKKAGTRNGKEVQIDKATQDDEETQAKKSSAKGKSGAKIVKSTDGITKKPSVKVTELGAGAAGAKAAIEATNTEAVDGDYALDEGRPIKDKTTETEASGKKPEAVGKPKFTKGKSALIGVGVALAVAIVGFVGIWFFTRKPTESCVVRFESNGGSFVKGTEMVCGKSLTKPSDPTKEGFEFQGWVYNGVPFDFENDTVKEDMVLDARWSVKDNVETVRVKFDTQGGTPIEGFDVAKGKTLNAPLTPTKAGYTFDGWYLGDTRFDFMEPVNESITLVAHWKEAPKETENNGGNSGNNNQQGVGNGSTVTPRPRCDAMAKDEGSLEDLKVGDTRNLTPYIGYYSADSCKVTYRSSNDSIAKVDGNSLIGVKAGNVTLSICVAELSGGRDLDCVKMGVKVFEEQKEPDPVAVTGVILSIYEANMKVGEDNVALRATVNPWEASNKDVEWSNTNPEVAVLENGKIVAKAVGTTTIKVTTKDGGYTAECKVTVTSNGTGSGSGTGSGTEEKKCGVGEKLENGECVKDETGAPTSCEGGQVYDEEKKVCVERPAEGGGGATGN